MQEMESQIPPTKIARLADYSSGIGQASCLNMERCGSNGGPESPKLALGLALERGGSTDHTPIKSFGFTILQLQELQLQSLIYRYIEAGFPVPDHLVLPIWKSVSTFLTDLHPSLHHLYPSFMGIGPLHLEYRNRMDPEPGRCRRTDGKKWRCSKQAVPGQKYCERHMHRGRQSSRKLVEAASHQTNNSINYADVNLSISLPVRSSDTQ